MSGEKDRSFLKKAQSLVDKAPEVLQENKRFGARIRALFAADAGEPGAEEVVDALEREDAYESDLAELVAGGYAVDSTEVLGFITTWGDHARQDFLDAQKLDSLMSDQEV